MMNRLAKIAILGRAKPLYFVIIGIALLCTASTADAKTFIKNGYDGSKYRCEWKKTKYSSYSKRKAKWTYKSIKVCKKIL